MNIEYETSEYLHRKRLKRGNNFSFYINLCVNNFSQFTFGLFGAQVRFFCSNIFISKMIGTNFQIYSCIKQQWEQQVNI